MLSRILKYGSLLSLVLMTEIIGAPLQVVRVTPQGINVPEPSQVIIEFDQPMAVLGQKVDPQLPISLSPDVKGQWRWLNEKTLSFHATQSEGFHKATKYTVRIASSLKSLNNSSLEKDISHEFVTSLPSPQWFSFKSWQSPTHPVIKGSFDQKVTKDSLEKHLYFVAKEDKTKRTAAVVTIDDRKSGEQPDKLEKKDEEKAAQYWFIEPATELAPNTEYQLYVEPGIMAEEATHGSTFDGSIFSVKTLEDFRFAGVRCQVVTLKEEAETIVFTPQNPQTDKQKCDPQAPIELLFTSPVVRSEVKKYLKISPDPTQGTKDLWGEREDVSRLEMEPPANHLYAVSLPGGLKASSTYTVSVSEVTLNSWEKVKQKIFSLFRTEPSLGGLRDEFGRSLGQPFQLTISLDDRKPNFVIAHHQAVLEKNVDSEIPLYVNNLQSVTFTYQTLTAHTKKTQQVMNYPLSALKNVQYAIPFQIRQMLQGQSGAVYGILSTVPEVKKTGEQENTLFAQVTPYQVQIKMGPFNTLVWVTDLATGRPVEGAKVSLFAAPLSQLEKPEKVLSEGKTNAEGIVMLDGQEKIDPKNKKSYAWRPQEDRLWALVEKEGDMALLPLIYAFEIDTYRASGEKFWSSLHQKYHYITSWGTTAQGIYRAGDTVQYKIYVRNRDPHRFTLPPKGRYDLEIIDPTNKVVHEVKNVTLNEFGALAGEVKIPSTGAIGWYRFELKAYFSEHGEEPTESKSEGEEHPHCVLAPMQVLVSDFTPAPFKVSVEANGDVFFPAQELMATTAATLHGGGAFTDTKAEITVLLQAENFRSSHPLVEGFSFGHLSPDTKDLLLVKKEGVLDKKGEYDLKIPLTSHPIFYGKLLVEGKVTDDRGKSISAMRSLKYLGGTRLVGMHPKKWVFKAKKPADIEVVVVDEKGNPVPGAVSLKIEKKETSIAKVKTAGNVYKTTTTHTWQEITTKQLQCEKEPIAYQFTPPAAGLYKVTATTKDDQQRPHACEMEIYVAGSDFVAWGEETDTYLPVVPERKEYQVGETARFLIKNPYPNATALVTVERSGVIDQFIQTLPDTSSFIEIPVKADYMPNFYVSVTAFSPRSGEPPLQTGQLDLNKPTFRMGYAKVSVKDHYKEIIVSAKPEKETYKPREKVKVDLTAVLKHSSPTSEPIELAVVVIDEAVLDLLSKGKQSYDPYQGFYEEENLSIRNFSLLNGLVGRMKFEKKGANPGGDGGGFGLNMRNIFKFVSYWNPSLIVDATGKATIEFEAPDNLTGWKILAIAMTPTDRMGVGEGSFKVNKPTEIRPVLPNHLSAGDQLKAGFSIMNRTDQVRQLQVVIEATGPLKKSKEVHQETLTLEPFKREVVYLPLETLADGATSPVPLTLQVRAGDKQDEDQLQHILPVKEVTALETVATSGRVEGEEKTIPISIPSSIYSNPQGLQVTLASTILTQLSGVFRYMRDYPYQCWEQKISRAIVASTFKHLRPYLNEEAQWPEAEAFIKEVLDAATGFQANSGGMAYFTPKLDYVDPFLSAYTAVSFGWLREQGYTLPTAVEENLINYLETLLKQPFTESYYTPGMVANTRAVILEGLSLANKLPLEELERFYPFVKEMNAYGKSCFIRAALKVEGGKAMAEEALKSLLSHFHETSETLTLAEEQGSDRMLDSPLRATCSTLETFIRFAQTEKGEALIGNKAIKLARAIRETQKTTGHWSTTQENLYCAKALSSYCQAYEKEGSSLHVRVKKADQEIGTTTFSKPSDPQVTFMTSVDEKEAGQETKVTIAKQGNGSLYYTTRLQYKLQNPSAEAVNAGLEVKREYSRLQDNQWVLVTPGMAVQRGDLIRVDLYLSVPGDRTFIVLNDPLPGCLETVNKDLATASLSDQQQTEVSLPKDAWWYQRQDWIPQNAHRWSFYHQEMRHDCVRFYADYLPTGHYHLSYVAQVIADGSFMSPAPLAEEMYHPETYGRGEPHSFSVAPKS